MYTLKARVSVVIMTLAVIMSLTGLSWAATYYVDATAGNDANAGTSTQTAWKSLANINYRNFNPGDNILFKKGEVWREQLMPGASGQMGNPIVFGAYGSGAYPIFNGADILSNWTPQNSSQPSPQGPTPEALWYFEESGSIRYDSSANHNDLKSSTTIASSSDHQQGYYSASLDASLRNSLSVSYSSLSAHYPLKKSPTTAFTIGGWVNFWKSINNYQTIYSHPAIKGGLQIRIVNKMINAFTHNGTDWVSISSDAPVTTQTWYHVAIRWDTANGELAMFINGQKQLQTLIINDFRETNSNLVLGNQIGTKRFASVLLDEWFAFSSALSTDQITAVFQGGVASLSSSASSGPIYYTTVNVAPRQIFQNGVRLTKVAALNDLTTSGTWCWDGATHRLYVRCTDDNAPTNHVMEVSKRDYCLTFSHSYLTFQNLAFNNANFRGVSGVAANVNCAYITIQDCLAANNYEAGIQATTANGPNCDHWLIQRCVVSYNGAHGIVGSNHITNWIIQNNYAHHNCAFEEYNYTAGIEIYDPTSSNNTVQYNVSYYNGLGRSLDKGIGIWFDTVGPGHVCRYNITYGNNQSGIMVEDSDGVEVYYNLSYDNGTTNYGRGILLSRNSSGNKIYNNTCYGNYFGIDICGTFDGSIPANDMLNNQIINNISVNNRYQQLAARFGGENDGVMGHGNVYTNNCLGPEGTNFVMWGQERYKSTYAALESGSGAPNASIKSFPQFLDPANANFRLQPTSPCINMGLTLNLTPDLYGVPVPVGQPPDVGSSETTQ